MTERGIYHFSAEVQQLTSFINNEGVEFRFTQGYSYYVGHRGDNSDFDSRASGAYIFRPESQFPETLYVIGKEHALKIYEQSFLFTTCFCGIIRSNLTPVAGVQSFFL